MFKITWRITGLMFLTILITVFLLVYLANHQMELHFNTYLNAQSIDMINKIGMDTPEQIFLQSIHHSLYWVGAILLILGLIASFLVAQSITIPIRKLGKGVDSLKKGNYGEKVDVIANDEIGELAVAFNDMSKSLADSITLRKQLLADIAHELKTPLSVIQGNLEGMLENVIKRSDEQIQSLYEETLHLNRMINDLKDLTLVETNQLTLEKKATDINILIGRALNMLEAIADDQGILFVKKLQPVPDVFVDVNRINQVLYNLLVNALRYTPDQGIITVYSALVEKNNESWVQIIIEDTGCGISQKDLPFIFEHFYRADKSRDKKSGGSGIGLAIVKQLLEIHNGSIQATSVVGQGSRFIIYLPVSTDI